MADGGAGAGRRCAADRRRGGRAGRAHLAPGPCWRDSVGSGARRSGDPDCVVCWLNLGHELLEAGAPGAALGTRPLRARFSLTGPRATGAWGLPSRGWGGVTRPSTPTGLASRSTPSLTLRLSLASALLAAGRFEETVGVVDEAGRSTIRRPSRSYFGAAAARRPEAPVPRLGLVRAWRPVGDRDRARGESSSAFPAGASSSGSRRSRRPRRTRDVPARAAPARRRGGPPASPRMWRGGGPPCARRRGGVGAGQRS